MFNSDAGGIPQSVLKLTAFPFSELPCRNQSDTCKPSQ